MYLDADGGFHAIFHHCYHCPRSCVCGGHGYSLDGKQWYYPYINGSAYWENATLAKSPGEVVQFYKRERPHLVFAADGVTPVALTNGAGVDGIGEGGDATWTFLQPIKS